MLRLLLVVTLLMQPAPDAVESPLVLYEPPMFTTVVDPFRPPAHIGAPGNRGLEYGSSENQPVRAAAAGYVVFAGQVAGRKVITIEHNDGVSTTYSGLSDIWVTDLDYVWASHPIAIAADGFHFGARLGNHYLDPQVLFDASQRPKRPRLLPPPG